MILTCLNQKIEKSGFYSSFETLIKSFIRNMDWIANEATKKETLTATSIFFDVVSVLLFFSSFLAFLIDNKTRILYNEYKQMF